MSYNNYDIKRFLQDELSAEAANVFRTAMNEDAELALTVRQTKLELLVVEELDQRFWKKNLRKMEQDFLKMEQLENRVVEELDNRFWRKELQELEQQFRKQEKLETGVIEQLDKNFWKKELQQLETQRRKEEKLEEGVVEQLDKNFWKKELQELEQQHRKTEKMEELVVEELDKQHWKKELQNQEQKHKKSKRRGRIIRMGYWASAAAAALIGAFLILPFLFDGPAVPPTDITDLDYNYKNTTTITAKPARAELMAGTWVTTIEEQENWGLFLKMVCLPDGAFTIETSLVAENIPETGDKTLGRGTWSIDNRTLRLDLDMSSIALDLQSDDALQAQITNATLELWLKTKRLFTSPLTIIELSSNYMILLYDNNEGIEWVREAG